MLFINAGVGFWQEFKADNAIALLKQRLALKARVKRDGEWKDIEAKLLVPGDVVLVKLGNIVPADLKLIGGAYLSVDQSALTGESLPVDKKVGDDAYSGLDRQAGRDGRRGHRHRHEDLFRQDRPSRRAGEDRFAFPARRAAHRQFPHSRDGRPRPGHRARCAVPSRSAARNRAIRAHPHRRLDPCRSAGRAFRHHGGRRRAAGAIQGDRLAPRRDRRDGGHGHAVQRQDRNADQERTDARRPAAGAGVTSRRTPAGGGAGLAARCARRDRCGDPRRRAGRFTPRQLRGEGVPPFRSGRQARRGRDRTRRQTLQGRQRRAASHRRSLRARPPRNARRSPHRRSGRRQGIPHVGRRAHG